jgi:hypothetical protein
MDSATRELLQTIQPGGVILDRANIQTAEQTAELTAAIRAVTSVPPLIAMDQEGGRVDRLREILPPMPSADLLTDVSMPAMPADSTLSQMPDVAGTSGVTPSSVLPVTGMTGMTGTTGATGTSPASVTATPQPSLGSVAKPALPVQSTPSAIPGPVTPGAVPSLGTVPKAGQLPGTPVRKPGGGLKVERIARPDGTIITIIKDSGKQR